MTALSLPSRRSDAAAPVCALIAAIALSSPESALAQTGRRAGDFLSYAMPAATLGVELARGEREGAWQFVTAFSATLVAAEGSKHVLKEWRPDGGDRYSFPSGHAARAFSAATYVHRRHGFEYAVPLYAAATYVGHTRVQAVRHRWGDVIGSAALSAAATWWLVDPKRAPPAVTIVPVIERRFVGV
ncbi:MAG: phosphatase PAP2 family protein, partial [Burkholderiales bacterium]